MAKRRLYIVNFLTEFYTQKYVRKLLIRKHIGIIEKHWILGAQSSYVDNFITIKSNLQEVAYRIYCIDSTINGNFEIC